jgi:phenylpropionate dioxygenase-like ring-hydroxylating dioxygenase large terminal subunit
MQTQPIKGNGVNAEDYVRRSREGHLYAVDHSIYLDESVYRAELEKIFQRQWIFVGLEAEVPRTGSFKTTWLANVPVLIVRDEDGKLHVYENVCLHRGAMLMRKTCGETQRLVCMYHRWTYDLKGRLTGVPWPEKFTEDFRKDELKLSELPRVDTHAGMIFASYRADIEPLSEYLGEAKKILDTILAKGEVELLGNQRYHVKANWKLFIENTVDGYHPGLLHTMIFPDKGWEYNPAQGFCRKFKNGHGLLQWPASKLPESAWNEEAHMPIALSKTKNEDGWDYSVSIFPNVMVLQIADIITIRQLVQKAVDQVDVITYNLARKDESPEIKKHRAWVTSGQFGSAGIASLDDKFAMEAVQVTASARYKDTLLLRGDLAQSGGELTTEFSLRGFYEKWTECLKAA